MSNKMTDKFFLRRLRLDRPKTTANNSMSDSLTLSDSVGPARPASRNSLFRNNSTNSYQSGKSGFSFRSNKSGHSNITVLTSISSSSSSNSRRQKKKKRGKLLRSSKYEEEVSDGQLGINERELNSMNKHIPALKGYNGKVATFRQHYYPEGGWGWVITICGFLVQMYTTGLQFSFGVLYLRILKIFATENIIFTGFIGTGCIAVSFGLSPVIVAFCRRKSTRLTAVMGGLVMSLALLFASFATQLHQVLLSYGIIFGIGCGLVRETSVLMLSQYFKRKRELVEILSSLGQGFGIIVFSNIIDILIEYVGWRFGLQIITGLVCGLFFLGMFYRSASLYHPQRRAILHLKDMSKKKGKDKSKIDNKPAYFDFTTLHVSSLQVIILSTILTSAGAYTPFITLILILRGEDLVERYVELNSYLGVGIILGVSTFGLIIISRSAQCVIPTIYLLKTAVFGLGGSLVTLTVVQGYYGYLLFVVLYGFFLGGYHYVLKVYTYECIRAKHFPRAWSFVQGSKSFPMLVGIPISQLINQSTGNPKSGFYLSFSLVFLGALVLFLVNSRKHKRDHVCKKCWCGAGEWLEGGERSGRNSRRSRRSRRWRGDGDELNEEYNYSTGVIKSENQ